MVPDLAHRHDEHGRGEPREAIDVGDHARHQLGGVQRGEEGQRHALDVRVQLAADAGDDPLADRGHQVGLAEAADALEQVDAEHGEREELEHDDVALEEDVVHGGLDEPGRHALGGGDDEGEEAPDERADASGAGGTERGGRAGDSRRAWTACPCASYALARASRSRR